MTGGLKGAGMRAAKTTPTPWVRAESAATISIAFGPRKLFERGGGWLWGVKTINVGDEVRVRK